MKIRAALVLALFALMALPAAAQAKPGVYVLPAQTSIYFQMPASNGYHLSVFTFSGRGKHSPNVSVLATKGDYAVQYAVHGRVSADGEIDARLPGVGRIAVRFQPTRVRHETVSRLCHGRASVIQEGVFRGTIAVHGERDYTEVHRRQAPGQVAQSFRQVCHYGPVEKGGGSKRRPKQTILFSQLDHGRRSLHFYAFEGDIGFARDNPVVQFNASVTRRHHGLFVSSSVTVTGKAGEVSASGPGVAPEEAIIEPPAPFQGSATFHLDSPKSSTWTGDLSVELPGIGPVRLAGPKFGASVCAGEKCRGDAKGDTQIGILVIT
ncbi:MAG TPA: hypothetical protein VMT37_10750 [Solirubrobacterales bacterium]|nr:hypothetical protein [Solirubrobacterales bacterium]